MKIDLKQIWRRLVMHLDGPLLILGTILISVNLVALYSASNQSTDKIIAQLTNMSVAVTVMWVAANISPQRMMLFAPPLYLLGFILLIGVAVAGDVVNGARRWLHIGVTRIQPSEIMKIAMPMMLAWYFDRREASLKIKDFLIATIIMLLPVALILKQPDLGTAILVGAASFYILFLAGLSWYVVLGLVLAGVSGIYFVTHWDLCIQLFHDYQCRRVATMIDPMADPLGDGYHTIQGTIAIGSGGIFGKGWLAGTQTHLDFIPERTTDFIFAVFAEEFGLVGNCLLLILYLAIIGRGLYISARAANLFGRLLAGSIALSFFTYAFVNMGMVSGILPVVGVPLPMVSYGGTALVTLSLGFGILMSIHSHRKMLQS
ncbi:rod shape determining protein RodA [Chitinivorax tropicus]|uniref:Peptidoglycan glycosyltransferase MrdB n=1 Tax=Chitinivorax tropicus TaxID=714531 RepID=A0A840MHT8_9PROT|nr:rod shape-determining protein RodA [Chitinivorax tropicus]MBB5017960.1 rod shape determining protein RodA [Chitinivorax tropicus]